MRSLSLALRHRARLAALLAAALPATAAAQTPARLTGLTVYGTYADGTFGGGTYWNALGGDFAWNAYATRTATPASLDDFLNRDNGAEARLDVALTTGRNTFYLWAASLPGSHLGFNLFLDGGDLAPDLSGHNATGEASGLASSQGRTTFGLVTSHTAPGAGLTWVSGNLTYAVASFAPVTTTAGFAAGAYGVGALGAAQGTRVYKLELDVASASTTAPEPATVALMATGLAALAGAVRVRRRG
jgi:hypothetical protein